MGARAFLALVPEAARAHLAEELRGYNIRLASSLVQLYYEDRRVHYELWVQRRLGQLEIGLHFEGPREDNLRRLALLAERFDEIAAALGPGPEGHRPELEEWTASWTRVHETWPLEPLTETFLGRVARRLAAYIATLQPLVVAGESSTPTPAGTTVDEDAQAHWPSP